MIAAAAASELGAGTGECGLCTTTSASELEAVGTIKGVDKISEFKGATEKSVFISAVTVVTSDARGTLSEFSFSMGDITVCDDFVTFTGEFVSVVVVVYILYFHR